MYGVLCWEPDTQFFPLYQILPRPYLVCFALPMRSLRVNFVWKEKAFVIFWELGWVHLHYPIAWGFSTSINPHCSCIQTFRLRLISLCNQPSIDIIATKRSSRKQWESKKRCNGLFSSTCASLNLLTDLLIIIWGSLTNGSKVQVKQFSSRKEMKVMRWISDSLVTYLHGD